MRFRSSAPLALILIAVLVVGALTFMSNRLFSGLTDEVETGQFDLMQAVLENALSGAESKALARAEIIAALPTAAALVAAQNRDGLLAEYAAMFAIQKEKYGVDQAQFHVPPATSLLRLQAPDKFGDDLTKSRPLVVAANRDKAVRKGFAIARTGPAIFGVAPVKDAAGAHVGTFEFGLDFGALLDGLKASFGMEFAVFIEEKPLRDFGTGVDPARLADQNRVGRFIRWHATNTALVGALAADADLSVVNEPTTYVRSADGTPYGVLLFPLKNAAGDALGVIVVARDFSPSREATGRSLVWQIAFAIFAVVVLAGAAIVVIRGMVLRPLGVLDARLGALRTGERKGLLDDTDRFPPEMERIARHIEQLAAPREDGA
jgi:methyl-accepting chemotaxis protein